MLLGRNADERMDVYRQTKQLYSIRSRIIHGCGNDVRETEQLTCNLLRRVLQNKILPHFESR
jgi:hypothetical protein